MATKEHIENGQKAAIIRQSVFVTLMKYCECDTGDDTETIGMSVRNFGYSINFYGNVQNNYELTIDEFGYLIKGEWIECEPTEAQMTQMKRLLANEILRINTLLEEEALEEAYAIQEQDDEMRYGHPGAIYGKMY